MQELDKVSITELILKVREGCDEAFSELVRRYLPMIEKVTASFVGGGLSRDEVFCEASVAFYKAAMTYDISRTEVTFGLYSRICVYRKLCDLVGKEKNKEGLFSDLDVDTISVQSGVESALLARERMQAALSSIKSLLSDYEYEVFFLHLEGYATPAIAQKLSQTSKSVDNAKARAVKRLREHSELFSDIF